MVRSAMSFLMGSGLFVNAERLEPVRRPGVHTCRKGAELLRTGNATIISRPHFLVTNNQRRRTVPVSPGVQYRCDFDASGACVGAVAVGFDHGQSPGSTSSVAKRPRRAGLRDERAWLIARGWSGSSRTATCEVRSSAAAGAVRMRFGWFDRSDLDGLCAAFVNAPNARARRSSVCVYMPQAGAGLLDWQRTILNADLTSWSSTTAVEGGGDVSNIKRRDRGQERPLRRGPFREVSMAQYLAWVNIVSGRASV